MPAVAAPALAHGCPCATVDSPSTAPTPTPPPLPQEVYRAALFAVFFAQVLLAGALPRIGKGQG